MKKQYAEAIRYGIKLANETKFGEIDDPYYEKRKEANWAYFMESTTLNKLTKEAFDRRRLNLVQQFYATHSPEECAAAEQNADRAWTLYTETRSQREIRLLREEVVHLRELVKEHLGD